MLDEKLYDALKYQLNLSDDDIKELESIKSNNNSYTIPVEWSVYSTVNVHANNLAEAIAIAQDQIDSIPISNNNEYVDGSYKINIEDKDDAIVAQEYTKMSDIFIDKDRKIHGDFT